MRIVRLIEHDLDYSILGYRSSPTDEAVEPATVPIL